MKARLLVIDDERRMVEILAMVLTREGYEVRTSVDPGAALGELVGGGFDLLITDLRMGGTDGLTVLARAPDRPGAAGDPDDGVRVGADGAGGDARGRV
jgi:two-component system response regulator HydG